MITQDMEDEIEQGQLAENYAQAVSDAKLWRDWPEEAEANERAFRYGEELGMDKEQIQTDLDAGGWIAITA